MITTDIAADVRSAAPAVRHRLTARPRAAQTATRPPGRAAHDPTLVLAALDELEAKRRGLEWLVEAELLWRCLP
jgi:hypothetical protein